MIECLIVGAGGFIGSVFRYLIGLIPVKESWNFPVKTFCINIVGAFVIGMIAALTVRNDSFPPRTGTGKILSVFTGRIVTVQPAERLRHLAIENRFAMDRMPAGSTLSYGLCSKCADLIEM